MAYSIMDIQTAGDQLGVYMGPLDGIDGEKTYAGVWVLQELLGITQDGLLGEVTEKNTQKALWGIRASEDFSMGEYACECEGEGCAGFYRPMNKGLIEGVQRLRNVLGSPVVITSGVRCPVCNDAVGGVPDSLHLRGQAADLYCSGYSVDAVAEVAIAVGLGVIRYYDRGFVHVEV